MTNKEVNSAYLEHYGISYAFPEYAKWLAADTGVECTEEECREAARKMRASIDAYNVLCQRALGEQPVVGKLLEELPGFPASAGPKDQVSLRRLGDDYCKLRGYDLETGVPTRDTLVGLGLGDIADRLYPAPLTPPA